MFTVVVVSVLAITFFKPNNISAQHNFYIFLKANTDNLKKNNFLEESGTQHKKNLNDFSYSKSSSDAITMQLIFCSQLENSFNIMNN